MKALQPVLKDQFDDVVAKEGGCFHVVLFVSSLAKANRKVCTHICSLFIFSDTF